MGEKKGFFSRLVEGLTKTRDNIVSGIDAVFSGFSKIDEEFYEELEEILIMGDLGVKATEAILDDLRDKVKANHIKQPEECKQLLIDSIKEQMKVEETAYRFENEKEFDGLLKRLEYTSVDVINLSKGSALLKNEIWENTQFLYVLTGRYGASFIYDYDTEDVEHFAGYYLLHNSVTLRDSFEIIEDNCSQDISEYKEQYKPDRRDNALMNSSIRKIVDLMNETTQEAMLVDMEKDALSKSDDLAKRLEFIKQHKRQRGITKTLTPNK